VADWGVSGRQAPELNGSTGRVACLENLELLLSPLRGEFDFFLPGTATAAELVAHSVPAERIRWLTPRRRARSFLNDWTVVNQSDLTEQLHRAGISRLVPSYRSSARLERWARAEGISLLSPSWRLQQLLENKVAFDATLRAWGLPAPRHCVLGSPADAWSVPWFPCVLQVARGEGSAGTFLVRSRDELRELLQDVPFRYPLLVRELISGPAYGVTIVVGSQDLLVSAIRAQTTDLAHPEEGFLATQWCRRNHFSRRLLDTMARVFGATGSALQAIGFRGAAGLDFMVDGDRVLIIECNPRFTAATPQLSLVPPLLHELHFPVEYVRAVTGERLAAHRPFVPDSGYEGACVDFSAWAVPHVLELNRRRVFAMPRIGVYDFRAATLRFVSEDLATLCDDSRLLFHYSSRLGSRIGPRTDLGSLVSNFPVFDFSSGAARLMPSSERLLETLLGEVLARPTSRRSGQLALPLPPVMDPPTLRLAGLAG
jgi:glutathione synthase/RimK-type ligase-like ATP-grasp enzyme